MNSTAAETRAQHLLTFDSHEIKTIKRDGQLWMSGTEIGRALQYADPDTAIKKLFNRYADEFTSTMTKVIKVMTAGGRQAARFFSLRGAHLLAMFSRTNKAKEFRVWVLNILDREVADLEARAAAGERIDDDTKMELVALCSNVEYLRSWWERYGTGVRGLNDNAAAAIHSHFVDGVCVARSLVRQFRLESTREAASKYPWDAGSLERWQYSMKTARGSA